MLEKFVVEHWHHVGGKDPVNGASQQFFVVKVAGPRGKWPLRAYILGPDMSEADECRPHEEEVDLEFEESAFIEIECPVEDAGPGEYRMRLYIRDEHVGDFPFQLHAA
jgi:hypothetical protein